MSHASWLWCIPSQYNYYSFLYINLSQTFSKFYFFRNLLSGWRFKVPLNWLQLYKINVSLTICLPNKNECIGIVIREVVYSHHYHCSLSLTRFIHSSPSFTIKKKIKYQRVPSDLGTLLVLLNNKTKHRETTTFSS